MGLIAILTMIVISFALVVGAAIGMLCGEIFGDLFDGDIAGACEWDTDDVDGTKDTTKDGAKGGVDTNTSGAKSWFGGAIEALFKYTGASQLVALPEHHDHPLEKLTMRLFATPSGIDWNTTDISNPSVELVEKLYKLYSAKQQRVLESDIEDKKDISNCGCDVKTQTKAGYIVENLRTAGVSLAKSVDDTAGLMPSTVVYADVGAGDCKLTLAIAKAIHASKIYNIDVANYCPEVAAIHYIDGSMDKTIDIPDNSVDIVTMIYSLHHMVDHKHKIAETKRILKPGGILLIQDHSVENSDTKRMIELQHCLHMINNYAARDVILEYNEFKKLIERYILEISLVLFSREEFDKLLLGISNGSNDSNDGNGDETKAAAVSYTMPLKLSMLLFNMRQGANYDNTFIAVYKKLE